MKRRNLRCLKLIAVLACGFVAFQILGLFSPSVPSNPQDPSQVDAKKRQDQFVDHGTQTFPASIPRHELGHQSEVPLAVEEATVVAGILKTNESSEDSKPSNSLSGERLHGLPNDSKSLVDDVVPPEPIDVSKVLAEIDERNSQQFIRNAEIFGPVDNDTVVIAIQVHNRVHYLRQLIVSLSVAKDIEKTLLVFSHDFWDPAINALVASIDFAKSIQIFYPYSIQTHSTEFPGETSDDCPRDATKEQAQKLTCINRNWPDLYGHYREAKFTQTKHHWWWKANRIFDQLDATKHHTGPVVFLEEDHHVAEDFLHVLALVNQDRLSNHKDCDIICLGTYLKNLNFPRHHKTVVITPWISAKHNMGMTFTRALWQKIHKCRREFCTFDDYNWDWSLHQVGLTCLPERLRVMLVKAPRVFHVGECGVHHQKKDCETSLVVKKVQDILKQATKYLYPKELIISEESIKNKAKKNKIPKGNGGWGDLRDQLLCQNMALPLSDKDNGGDLIGESVLEAQQNLTGSAT